MPWGAGQAATVPERGATRSHADCQSAWTARAGLCNMLQT